MKNILKLGSSWCLAAIFSANSLAFGAVPVITGFSPASGSSGTPVTITGANFGTSPSNNIVYFGAVRATVATANQSNLLVTVPSGATYAPVTVTVGGLVAYSGQPFQPGFAGSPGISTSTFAPPVTVPTSGGPIRITIGDLNGDGKPDFVVAGIYANTISIYQNLGTGGPLGSNSFASPIIIPFGSGDNPYWITLADVDGDGRLDIVAPDQNNNVVTIFRNFSSGGALSATSFASPVSFPAGSHPREVVVRDLDGDGRPDIAVANIGDDTISILKNIGTAGSISSNSFATQIVFPAGSQPHTLAVGDLDRDGKPDLAVGNYTSPFVSLFRNVSVAGTLNSNSFAARVDLPANYYCNSIVLGDVDGDGRLDIVCGTAEGASAVSVFHNVSNAGVIDTNSFEARVDFASGGWVNSVALGDLDGDGKLDILSVTQIGNAFSVYPNQSVPGTFTSGSLGDRVDFASGSNPNGISVCDLNGDGRPDVLFGNFYDGTLTFYQNAAASVSNGPTITSQPTNQTVSAGGTAIFSVTVTGSPTLYYQWWRGPATIIPGATSPTLTLSNVQPSDAGTYLVIVTNQFGFAMSSNAVLTVTGAGPSGTGLIVPNYSATTQIHSASGTFNEILREQIVYGASEFPPYPIMISEIRWRPDQEAGGPLSVTISNLQIHLSTTQANPDGLNATFAQNTGTNDTVVFNGALNISTAFTTLSNGTMAFDIKIPLQIPFVYDSTKGNLLLDLRNFNGCTPAKGNFANIAGAADATSRVFTHDLAATTASVADTGGDVLEIIYSPVAVPPVITQQPTNQTVSAGAIATFSVTAAGSPTLHYQWWHGPSTIIPGATSSTLMLSNVQPSDAGNYFVLVTNLFGFAQSSNAVLTVTGGGGGTNTCTAPPSGLVGWWKGEGNATDSAGTNNGILVNGVSFTTGEVGQGFLFNHTNQDVKIPANSNLDVGLGSGLTLEAWINPSDVSKYDPIFEYNPGDGVTYWGVHLYVIPTGTANQPGFLYANVQGVGDVWHQMQTANAIVTTNNLQHVALTYDKASGIARLYRNGAQVAQSTFGSFTPKTTGNLNIGSRPTDPANDTFTFSGVIDEPSVYNRALSSNEIAAIYNAGSSGKCTSTTTSNTAPVITKQPTNQTVSVGGNASFSVTATGSPTLHYQWFGPGTSLIAGAINPTLILSNEQPSNAGSYFVRVTNSFGFAQSSNAVLTVTGGGGGSNTCTPPPSGLVAWWKAEGNGLDNAGTNNGTLLGDLGFTNGEVGQAFNFTDNTQGVQVNASPSLAVKNMTIEAWIRPADVSDFHPVIEYGADTGLDPVQFLYGWNDPGGTTPGALFGILRGTNDTALLINSPAGILPAGQWSHIAMTFNFTNQTGTLYLNGTNVGSSVFTNGIMVPQTSLPVHIGYRPNTSGEGRAGDRLSGGLDEVSIYNRALSQSEIQAIYHAGSSGKCASETPLAIITQPTNTTAIVGSTAKLSVTAVGTGPLGYQWWKSNSIVAGATNSTLTFSNVQFSAAGSYHVVVSDSLTSVTSSNATLTVLSPPVATVAVVNTSASAGAAFDVPIVLVANGNENALSFTLKFDPARLTFSDINVGSGGGDAFLLPHNNPAGSGIIGVQLALPAGETFNAGTQQIVRVTFNTPILTGTQSVATAVSFTGVPIAKLLSDVQGHALAANFVNGTVTLSPSRLEGDASPVSAGNGTVDVFDWVQVGRFVAGLDTITNSSEFQKVDCAPRNTLGDGQLKVTDWVQAGRYAAGLDPVTLAGGPTALVPQGLTANASSGANPRQVAIQSGSTVKGMAVTLPITLEAQGDETALAFSLNFDPTALQYVSAVKGSAAGSANLVVNATQAADGKLAMVLCLPSAGSHFAAGTVEIAKVTFVALSSTTNNTVAFADLPVPRSISDTNATELTANYLGNSVVINPQPTVGLSYSGNTSLLSWPVWAGDFTLQAAGGLTPPVNWTNVPVTLQTNGNNIEITLPTPDQQIFFRLYHP